MKYKKNRARNGEWFAPPLIQRLLETTRRVSVHKRNKTELEHIFCSNWVNRCIPMRVSAHCKSRTSTKPTATPRFSIIILLHPVSKIGLWLSLQLIRLKSALRFTATQHITLTAASRESGTTRVCETCDGHSQTTTRQETNRTRKRPTRSQ